MIRAKDNIHFGPACVIGATTLKVIQNLKLEQEKGSNTNNFNDQRKFGLRFLTKLTALIGLSSTATLYSSKSKQLPQHMMGHLWAFRCFTH